MDHEREIGGHRTALLAVLATLVATVGLSGAPVANLQRHVYFAVLRVLKPAEAALRRMILVLARRLSVVLRPKRSRTRAVANPRDPVETVPLFQLFDPLKRFDLDGAKQPSPVRREGLAPINLSNFDPALMSDPLAMLRIVGKRAETALWRDPASEMNAAVRRLPASDKPVNAKRLRLRLVSLWEALDDLPAQAQRMARAVARHSLDPSGWRRFGPLRPGLPPGYKVQPRHDVERILTLCHSLAMASNDLTPQYRRPRIP